MANGPSKSFSIYDFIWPSRHWKTSIASAIAGSTGTPFRLLNAVTHNKKDMEVVVQEAKMHRHLVLILDEVHRLDKAKQDFLLPHLESGLLL